MDVAAHNKVKLKAGDATPVTALTRICLSCHRQFNDQSTHCPTDGTMLMTPPQNPLADSKLEEQYQIEGIIGSGGWSLVYKAKQKSLGRSVAIKILHSHLVLDPDKVMRFQREAEAASKFNHPSIPAVYDFGQLPSGQPYMVMAYVEGRSLAEIILEDGPMTIDRALEIFTQTTSGLAIAHERGIIHRDIKPSNILLTKEKGEVKILDFGLAKLVGIGDGETVATLTQAGHTIGTPAYMSPEQCLGLKLDARSDIYSLGCVMYETITGIRPFEGRDAFEAMSLHMRGDISFDNTPIKDTIPDTVEATILKTLAKNPADRYQSAQDLLRALDKISSQTQFRRSPFRFIYSFQRVMQQKGINLATMATSLAVTLLIIGTVVIGAYRAVEYMNQRNASTQRNISELYKDAMAKGERNFYAGNYTKATTYYRQASDLAENFGATDERLSSSLKRLQESLKKENKLDEVKKVEEHVEALKNSTYGLMYGTPEQNARNIIDLSAKREQKPKDVDLARQLCAVLNNQAALLFTQSNISDAKHYLDRAIEIEKNVLTTSDPEYATSLSNLAYYYSQRGDKAQAEHFYKQALDIRQRVLGSDDPKVGRSLRNLGDFYWKQGDIPRAQELMKQSAQVYRKQLPRTSADYAWTINNLGLICASQGNYPEARKLFQEALDIRKQLYGEEGLDVGRTMHNLAQLDTAEHKFAEAETAFRKAQRIYDTKLGTEHEDTIKCVSSLAVMYFNKADFADAEPLLKRIVAVLKQKRPGDPLLRKSYTMLEQIYQHQGRKDALKELNETMRALPNE